MKQKICYSQKLKIVNCLINKLIQNIQNHKKHWNLSLTNQKKIIFFFNPPISIEVSWIIGLTCLEVYSSIFEINTTNIKFELYRDTLDEFAFEDLKDELEEILSISDITPSHLQHEIIGPRIIGTY